MKLLLAKLILKLYFSQKIHLRVPAHHELLVEANNSISKIIFAPHINDFRRNLVMVVDLE